MDALALYNPASECTVRAAPGRFECLRERRRHRFEDNDQILNIGIVDSGLTVRPRSSGMRMTLKSRSTQGGEQRSLGSVDSGVVKRYSAIMGDSVRKLQLRRHRRIFKAQQALKKRAIAPQGNAQGLGGRLACLIHLTLQHATLMGKGFRQALHDLDNKLICLPDSLSRVIDKPSLDGVPARAKLFGHIGQKQRSELALFSPHIDVLVVEHRLIEISLCLLLCRRYLCNTC